MVPDKERRERLAFAIRAAMGRRSAQVIADAMNPKRSKETVARWARGDTVPSALDIAPLARALRVRLELLVDPPALPSYPLSDYLIPEDVRQSVQAAVNDAEALARADLEAGAGELQAAADRQRDKRRRRPA